jgi:hypothetical protein
MGQADVRLLDYSRGVLSRSFVWEARASVLLANLAALATASAVHGQTKVIYVDSDAPAGGNGTSWDEAFRSPTDADGVYEGMDVEIRIAGGIYKPADRDSSFHTMWLTRSVRVIGGFAGRGSVDPDVVDTDAYRTIFSADINGNDASGLYNDNAGRLISLYSDVSISIEGVELEGVAGFNPQSALYIQAGPRTVVRDVKFRNNNASAGGAVRIGGDDELVQFIDCTFIGNKAINGGAVHTRVDTSFTRCTFIGNQAGNIGGAVRANPGAAVNFDNCVFAGNHANIRGGAIGDESNTASAMTINLGLFIGNTAMQGSAIAGRKVVMKDSIVRYGYNPSPTSGLALVSIFTDNVANFLSVERCNIEDADVSLSAASGAVHMLGGNIDADPMFVDADGADNNPQTWTDNDLRPTAASPGIDAGRRIHRRVGETDINGAPRFIDGDQNGSVILDMGPYEFPTLVCPADFDESGFVDTDDFDAFVRAFEAGC